MAEINLSKYGITGTTEIVYNPSYEELFKEEMKPELEGYEKGQETELGAVNVMTGIYTGRSPKDKFIVEDENSKNTVWWTSDEYKNDNHRMSQEAWAAVKDIAKKELSNKRLFVVDAFCGANKDTRMAIRFIVEVAWQAHFVTNMFIKPTEEELKSFEPDFVVYNASKANGNPSNGECISDAPHKGKEICEEGVHPFFPNTGRQAPLLEKPACFICNPKLNGCTANINGKDGFHGCSYLFSMKAMAFSKRSKVFSRPRRTMTSNMPGLKVRPVRARRVG